MDAAQEGAPLISPRIKQGRQIMAVCRLYINFSLLFIPSSLSTFFSRQASLSFLDNINCDVEETSNCKELNYGAFKSEMTYHISGLLTLRDSKEKCTATPR